MRVVVEIPHKECKITVFAWNNRYLIKLEQGMFEQTFKVHEYDLDGESELHKIIDEPFIREALSRFDDMNSSLRQTLQRP